MEQPYHHTLFNHYCYGPADLLQIRKGDSTMWLSLRDSGGRAAQAIYYGCIYWRLDREYIHLSLVQKVTAQELMAHSDSVTMRELQKNATDVPSLLKEWEQQGLSFFLHQGTEPEDEFLVVAESMEFKRI